MTPDWDDIVERYKQTPIDGLRPLAVPTRRFDLLSGRVAQQAGIAVVVAGVVVGAILVPILGNSQHSHDSSLAQLRDAPSTSPVFPEAVYPTPTQFPSWGSPGGCPSLQNLSAPDPAAATAGALQAINARGVDELSSRQQSDPAYWPVLDLDFKGHPSEPPFRTLLPSMVDSGPAKESTVADLVRTQCGEEILARSWAISDNPSTSPGLATTFLLVVRNGHYLIWFTNP